MTKDTGGSAFAHGNPTDGGDPGMTLRDWFAGQALCSIPLRNWDIENRGDKDVIAQWAATAYIIAEAMLAERNK